MSGGYFSMKHISLEELADEISNFVSQQYKFKLNDTPVDEMSSDWDHGFTVETLNRIQKTSNTILIAAKMLKNVDYLLSQDIGENLFDLEWQEEISEYQQEDLFD